MKKIIILAAGLIACSAIFAQQKQEVSAWGSVGMSTLKYSTEVGKQKNGTGGSFGFGYNYYLNSNWSLGTGVEFSFHNAKTSFDTLDDFYMVKNEPLDFEYCSRMTKLKEEQNTMYINIPLIAQFDIPVFGEHGFYASGGFKIGIPASKKFKVKNLDMYNRGHFEINAPDEENDAPEFMGFGNFNRKNIKENLGLKVSATLAFEAGLKWELGDKTSLYTGGYFDYGLNDVRKKKSNHLIDYNVQEPTNFIHNSIVTSQYNVRNGDKFSSQNFVKKVHLMSVGLKVKFAFEL